jgi:hypothetical protein
MNDKEEPFSRSDEDQIYNTPEKWYVRVKWAYYAFERKRKNKRDFIRLLTLTSTKCYDVLLLKDLGVILTTNTGYSPLSVTFCECDPERYVLIRNSLPGARDFGGKIEQFVDAGSTHLSPRAEKWFPYDVINLDFTKPGFRHKGEKTSITMDTISKILLIQKFKKQSFTLFLTLPAIRSGDDSTGISQLEECLRTNLENGYSDFKREFKKRYPKMEITNYREFLLTVVPKLIIKYGQTESFDIHCRERCTYVNTGARAVMITFIFDCECIGLSEGYGGSNPAEILANRYPKRILEILTTKYRDINEEFAKDRKLLEKYLQYTTKYD